eukprot:703633-Amphidinium_carterae.1
MRRARCFRPMASMRLTAMLEHELGQDIDKHVFPNSVSMHKLLAVLEGIVTRHSGSLSLEDGSDEEEEEEDVPPPPMPFSEVA